MASLPEIQEGAELLPGETWCPRGQGLARTIIRREVSDGGQRLVRYRTRYGEFTTGERDFRFWADRLSATAALAAKPGRS
jgi:hypothetical protein